jgi:pimeloyl-ACP methyl ester carboxylesterase
MPSGLGQQCRAVAGKLVESNRRMAGVALRAAQSRSQITAIAELSWSSCRLAVGSGSIARLPFAAAGSRRSLLTSTGCSFDLDWRWAVPLLAVMVAEGHRLARRVVGGIAAGLVVACCGTPTALADTGVSCRQYDQSGSVPASVEPGGQALPYTIRGELCATPAELRDGSTVQLLLHGATYNHSYWDFGTIDGVRYSYARDLATAGFPTFAFDQIGTGQSTRPPSSDIDTAVAAYVEHQAVQGLRSGSITGVRFGKVIEVGHSLGSLTSWQEAITYQDVDGLIITGAVHHTTQTGLSALAMDVDPANQDPKFQGLSWSVSDPGYLTTVPGTRGSVFYNTVDADPNVIAADDNEIPFPQEAFATEAGKDTAASGQFDGLSLTSSTATQAIQVPVLIVMGANDDVFCGPDSQGVNFDCSSGTAIARQETPYYSARAQLEGCSVPYAGHDVSLHLDFLVEEAAAAVWSYHFVGQHGTFGSGQLPKACGWSG